MYSAIQTIRKETSTIISLILLGQLKNIKRIMGNT